MAGGHGICLASTLLPNSVCTVTPHLSAFPQWTSLNWVILLHESLEELVEENNSAKFLPLDYEICLKGSPVSDKDRITLKCH